MECSQDACEAPRRTHQLTRKNKVVSGKFKAHQKTNDDSGCPQAELKLCEASTDTGRINVSVTTIPG